MASNCPKTLDITDITRHRVQQVDTSSSLTSIKMLVITSHTASTTERQLVSLKKWATLKSTQVANTGLSLIRQPAISTPKKVAPCQNAIRVSFPHECSRLVPPTKTLSSPRMLIFRTSSGIPEAKAQTFSAIRLIFPVFSLVDMHFGIYM